MDIRPRRITAIIGPSGCGKSTLIRCFNRMNDLIPGARVSAARCSTTARTSTRPGWTRWWCAGTSAWSSSARTPSPSPSTTTSPSGPGSTATRATWTNWWSARSAVRRCGTRSRTQLKKSALALSGGQQQRLCIARAIAVEPDVILMDEPASALDPIATVRIEDLMQELKQDYSIVIVTHNMQQAARVSDETAFLYTEVDEETSARWGILVEYGRHQQIFTKPHGQADRRLRVRPVRIGSGRAKREHAGCIPQRTGEPRPGIVRMGALVERSTEMATTALIEGDIERAQKVRDGDARSTPSSWTSRSARWPCWPSSSRWPATCV